MEIEKRSITEHRIVQQIPWRETCFGCNGGPNQGIGMRAFITEDGYIVGICRTKASHQGFPDNIHGGMIATYFDEVLWHATCLKDPGLIAMTIEMTTKYFRAVSVGIELRVVAEPAVFEGRHIYVHGYLLLPDDTVAAVSLIHYLAVRQEHILNRTEPVRIKYADRLQKPESIRF